LDVANQLRLRSLQNIYNFGTLVNSGAFGPAPERKTGAEKKKKGDPA
jgi:hypothetical protein